MLDMERQPDQRDHGTVPLARIGLGGRRRRQLAQRFAGVRRGAEEHANRIDGASGTDPGIAAIFDDLATLDEVPGPTWRSSERYDTIDPAERALLVQLYRELLATVEGPILPFPVELVLGEDEAPELDEPATILSFETFRTRRAERAAATATSHQPGSDTEGSDTESDSTGQ